MTKETVSEVKPEQHEYPLRNKRREETRAALYAHFSNKYELGSEATVDSLRSAIATRETDTITFWRAWVEQETQDMLGEDTVLSFKRLIEIRSEPRFATLLQSIAHKYIEILTRNIATDFSLDPNVDLFPTLVAHMLWGANEHNILAWQEADGNYDLVAAGGVSAVDEVANIVNLVRTASKG